MKELIKEWQESWIPKDIINRDISFSMGTVRKIHSFAGIRRSGKTYIIYQIINSMLKHTPKESLIYINFEDERIEKEVTALTNLIPTIIEMSRSSKIFLFLDELQAMPKWDIWLRRVYDKYKNIYFFVTGSSSKISEEKLPRALRGRTITHYVFPLSFKEFLKFKNKKIEKTEVVTEIEKAKIKKAFNEFLRYGGFPEVVLEESALNKNYIVQDYFKTIIRRDIAEQYRIRNINLLTQVLKYLLNSTYMSYTKIVNTLKSQGFKVGKESVINYVKYAEEVFFCKPVSIFSRNIKDREQYPKKIYFTDNSFINFISTKFSDIVSKLFENTVAMELIRRQVKDISTELFYWKNPPQEEVDFVIKQDKVKQLIQVCYNINDEETRKRELRALLHASKELKCNNLLVITDDYDAKETISWFGIKRRIKYVPLWKWLLASNHS